MLEVANPISRGAAVALIAASPVGTATQAALDLKRDIKSAVPVADLTAGAGSETRTVTVDTNAVGVAAALYMAADGNYDEADADQTTTMPCTALALATGTGSKLVLTQGLIRNDAWNWTIGGKIYVSTTQGTLTQTAPVGSGDVVQCVGYAVTADIMDFQPSLNTIVLV